MIVRTLYISDDGVNIFVPVKGNLRVHLCDTEEEARNDCVKFDTVIAPILETAIREEMQKVIANHRGGYCSPNYIAAINRFINVCERYNIKTVSDLQKIGRKRFMRLRGVGVSTLKVAEDLFDSYRLLFV